MTRLATRRLIDAAASLDAADRALLNIWMNRGLDDAALARMTGMTEGTIAGRRERIVGQLGGILGLAPQDVRGALSEIVASRAVEPAPEAPPPAAPPASVAVAPPASAANGLPPASELATEPPEPNGSARQESVAPAAASSAPEDGSASRRRRWPWAGLALVGIVAVVVLVASLGSSGAGHPHHQAPSVTAGSPTSASTPASASTSASASTPASTPAPTRPAGHPRSQRLAALPGGSAHSAGTIELIGKGADLRLSLTVSGLPPTSRGHYEVWLYDSLVNSEAVGRLRSGATRLSLRLPADARRYHWIDVSFQPVGQVFHSGESVMRAANPLFGKAKAS